MQLVFNVGTSYLSVWITLWQISQKSCPTYISATGASSYIAIIYLSIILQNYHIMEDLKATQFTNLYKNCHNCKVFHYNWSKYFFMQKQNAKIQTTYIHFPTQLEITSICKGCQLSLHTLWMLLCWDGPQTDLKRNHQSFVRILILEANGKWRNHSHLKLSVECNNLFTISGKEPLWLGPMTLLTKCMMKLSSSMPKMNSWCKELDISIQPCLYSYKSTTPSMMTSDSSLTL